MSDSSYPVEISPNSAAGYFTPEQARNYYGKYSRDGVTYHWWNRPERIADTGHDSIVNYMNGNAARGAAPTVNYVASDGKLTLLSSPDLVTWTSNNGNATTIGVECSPHFTDSFMRKLGWLHDQLEQRYGKTLIIYVHFDWTQTECSPISKDRIRQEANNWKRERETPAPTPTPAPAPTVTLQIADIPNKKVRLIRDANLWDLAFKKYADAKAIKALPAGTIIEASATAKHPLGSTYYLSEYSYSKGIGAGINVKDVEDFVDVVAPPNPTPVIQPPKDAPTIPAPVITPTPTPVQLPLPTPLPAPTDYDKIQDDKINKLTAMIQTVWDYLSRYKLFQKFIKKDK